MSDCEDPPSSSPGCSRSSRSRRSRWPFLRCGQRGESTRPSRRPEPSTPMRILIVSPVTPYLPSHDGARAVVAHLVRNLGSVHTVGLVAATTPADTPEQRQWASGLCAWTRVVSAGRWRSSLSLQPGEGVAGVRAAVLEAVRDFAPDVLHLEGSVLAPLARLGGLPTVLAVRDADTLPSPGERRRVRRPWSWIDGRLDEWQQAAWEHAGFERADVVLTGDALPVGVDLDLYEFRRTGQSGRIVLTADLARPAGIVAAERATRRRSSRRCGRSGPAPSSCCPAAIRPAVYASSEISLLCASPA